MPAVKCSVANCYYHVDNNECKANSILVDIEQHANDNYDMEIGTINQENHSDFAQNKQDTICHTFKEKNIF